PDRGAAELPDVGSEVPTADSRAGVDALWAPRGCHRPARDLGPERPDGDGRAQPWRCGRVRAAADRGVDPRLQPISGSLAGDYPRKGTVPEAVLGSNAFEGQSPCGGLSLRDPTPGQRARRRSP